MRTERFVLSFIAVVIGLLVAAAAFFIYQSTRSINPNKIPTITIANPTPTPSPNIYLTIDQPLDERVQTKRAITVTGRTAPDATLILTTATDDQVVSPTSTGNYSLTTTLADGENSITITAISATGEEIKKSITVTSSSEEF